MGRSRAIHVAGDLDVADRAIAIARSQEGYARSMLPGARRRSLRCPARCAVVETRGVLGGGIALAALVAALAGASCDCTEIPPDFALVYATSLCTVTLAADGQVTAQRGRGGQSSRERGSHAPLDRDAVQTIVRALDDARFMTISPEDVATACRQPPMDSRPVRIEAVARGARNRVVFYPSCRGTLYPYDTSLRCANGRLGSRCRGHPLLDSLAALEARIRRMLTVSSFDECYPRPDSTPFGRM